MRSCACAIPFPDEARLDDIVLTRLAGRLADGAPLLRDSIRFFLELRSSEQKLRKRPGTAELLNWIGAMLEFGCDPAKPLHEQERTARATLPALSKVTEDQATVRELYGRWTTAPRTQA